MAGMIMDWREMAGRPTTRALPGEGPWRSFNSVWSGGKQVGIGSTQHAVLRSVDPVRCWIIAICWMAASAAEYVSVSSIAASLLTSAYLPQRVLPVCLHTATKIDPRLLSHPAIQSSRPHDVLLCVDPDVRVFLDHHVRQYRGYRRLRGATMRKTRNE